MPKAKIRGAPQWRTAPGLGPGPAAHDDADLDRPRKSLGGEPAAPAPARRSTPTRDSPVRAAARVPAPAAPNLEPASDDPSLYTHTLPGHRVEALDREAAAGSSAAGDDAPPDDAGAAAELDSSPAAQQTDPPVELGAPQVPLTVALPGRRKLGHQYPGERASRSAPDRTATIARRLPHRESFTRSVRSLEPISDPEAASFAGRFAADFQSFDEDNPSCRAEVLRSLLADPQACTWGWSGAGRQRADSPLPGRIYRSSETVVFVEVVVRATTYARACPPPDPTEPAEGGWAEPAGVIGPSCAPAESGPGWVAAEANWLRMTVPITRDPDDGRLVVDPHLVSDHSS